MDNIVYVDNMDKEQGIPSLQDESIPLSFYSPPYYNFKEYGEGQGIGKITDTYEQFLSDLERVNIELYKKIMPGGRLVINVTNMNSRKAIEGKSFVYPMAHDIVHSLSKIGYTFHGEVIWNKMINSNKKSTTKFLFGSYPYPPTPMFLTSMYENIFIFLKDGKRKVDKEIKEQSKLTFDEWKEFTKGIWEIPTDRNKNHPATFPIELAERIVRLYSFVDDTVLDPFAGTGTTIRAAEKWNRVGIGYEIETEYRY